MDSKTCNLGDGAFTLWFGDGAVRKTQSIKLFIVLPVSNSCKNACASLQCVFEWSRPCNQLFPAHTVLNSGLIILKTLEYA